MYLATETTLLLNRHYTTFHKITSISAIETPEMRECLYVNFVKLKTELPFKKRKIIYSLLLVFVLAIC